MSTKLRPATHEQNIRAKAAHFRLQAALEDAEAADCPKLARSIRRSLKSSEGAKRHMKRRLLTTVAAE